ncbi:DinB family protein [Flavobacterium sp. SM15]|uniref:DinB family protein n=1 Tax=Flavobacterium sp. SM15 TaxID=2908005 RepID=UPI001EDBC17F|nr:DinB family protein [Flavobacterium sp. SM15]MCG2612322.1 DinB family protein [Flavobacterium sp. SM15]
MTFNLENSIELLERTPLILETQLRGISDVWIHCNEGEETWSVFDVVGHLIHGEQTDWIARLKIILSEGADKNFKPFDRFAMFEESKGKSLNQLLEEFKVLREKNTSILKSKNITEKDFNRKGIHPVFGAVTLSQLLSCWMVHDLDHLAQINRIIAKQYKQEVGPWIEFLKILK